MSCVFCLINEGKIPSKKIYEDDKVIAILDISQATLGHTLVIPKDHYEDIFSIPTELYLHLCEVTKMLAEKLTAALNTKACNILNNNGELAGQTVKHFHIHIIPRYPNDDLVIKFTDHGKDVDLDALLAKLK